MAQTQRGKAQDKRKTAKKTLPKTKANVAKWRKNKGRMDIEGVDTKTVKKSPTKKVAPIKRVSAKTATKQPSAFDLELSRWEAVKKNPASVKTSMTISRKDWNGIYKQQKKEHKGVKYTYTSDNKWVRINITKRTTTNSSSKIIAAERRKRAPIPGGDTATISKKTQSAQQHGKLSKTENAKNLIRADYAQHGKDTGVAMRAYTENRISYAKYQELAKAGMRIFNAKGKK